MTQEIHSDYLQMDLLTDAQLETFTGQKLSSSPLAREQLIVDVLTEHYGEEVFLDYLIEQLKS